ncbi:hypothetical protein M405DRAFT_55812 [Rhizopogon salebrosus TDB-379]|nr:hypothetical protein M405DRAFT_55812 [Rhizopogon salebrosus TDB-379]
MHFPWDKVLPKVILLRLKRHGKRRRGTLMATSDVGSASVPPGITSVPALSTSTEMGPDVSATELHWRQASDIAQLSLPVLQATAGAVPIVGASIQAAVSGLLAILQAIDRGIQNKADLDQLTSRLYGLLCLLLNAPPARHPREQSRRESLVRMLHRTSNQLTQLHERYCLGYTSVTQEIVGCYTNIDRCLFEYLVSSQMQVQNDLHELLAYQKDILVEMQRLQCNSSGYVDATRYEHQPPVGHRFQYILLWQLNAMVTGLPRSGSVGAHIRGGTTAPLTRARR